MPCSVFALATTILIVIGTNNRNMTHAPSAKWISNLSISSRTANCWRDWRSGLLLRWVEWTTQKRTEEESQTGYWGEEEGRGGEERRGEDKGNQVDQLLYNSKHFLLPAFLLTSLFFLQRTVAQILVLLVISASVYAISTNISTSCYVSISLCHQHQYWYFSLHQDQSMPSVSILVILCIVSHIIKFNSINISIFPYPT